MLRGKGGRTSWRPVEACVCNMRVLYFSVLWLAMRASSGPSGPDSSLLELVLAQNQSGPGAAFSNTKKSIFERACSAEVEMVGSVFLTGASPHRRLVCVCGTYYQPCSVKRDQLLQCRLCGLRGLQNNSFLQWSGVGVWVTMSVSRRSKSPPPPPASQKGC